MLKMLDFEIIYRRIKSLTKTYQDNDTAKALGISPQAVADAKKRGRIPRTWYQVVEKDFGVTREELCRPEERVSARAQVDMPYSTNSMANAITANGSGPIHINYGKQEGEGILLEVSERERALILMMRKHASPAMWERLENDLMEQEKRYG
jgi:hypothetical protein